MKTNMQSQVANGMFLLNTEALKNFRNLNKERFESQSPIIESIIETIVEPIIYKC